MAELIVFAHDHGPDAHPMLYRPGDVIVVKKDGSPWGTQELNSPKFRILVVPGEPEDYEDLLGYLPPARDHNLAEITHRRRRAFGLDFTNVPQWNDVSRRNPKIILTELPAKVKRPPIPLDERFV